MSGRFVQDDEVLKEAIDVAFAIRKLLPKLCDSPIMALLGMRLATGILMSDAEDAGPEVRERLLEQMERLAPIADAAMEYSLIRTAQDMAQRRAEQS